MQTGLQSCQHLLVDDKIRLAEVLAALGVADDDVLHAQILQHVGGDLAGVGAGLLKEHVLCAHGHPCVLEGLDGGGNIHGGDTHHHVAPLGLGQQGLQLLGELLGFAGGLVHFPVAGDNGLTVSAIHNTFTPLSFKTNISLHDTIGCKGGAPPPSRGLTCPADTPHRAAPAPPGTPETRRRRC